MPDLAARHHPEPDGRRAPAANRPRADQACRAPWSTTPTTARAIASTATPDRAGHQVHWAPGHREEERREDLPERPDLVLELVLRLGFRHDQAGHERADDGRQPDRRGHERDREHQDERGDERRVGEQRPGEHLALQPARAPRGREPERRPVRPQRPTTSSVDPDRSPSAAPETTPMRISARTSSITAAPSTTRANVRSSTPMSASTRLVIPMLVAARASPTKAAVGRASPRDRARWRHRPGSAGSWR